MPLAIFDLDNTLLAGDSDYLWGQFLGELGVVDRDSYERENERFYQEYREGRLDIMAFLAFALKPLSEHKRSELDAWHARFMREKIEPLITTAAQDLIERHRTAGDTLLIITATNAFVTAPIAERLGITHLIATVPEQSGDRYTGRVSG
ncbi:MAG: HAD-IB family phosphatase, partial [Sedimenticolaceae bacterium]